MSLKLEIFDDFLPEPLAFRERATKAPFYDIRGPDGEMYKHINVRPSYEFEGALSQRLGATAKVGYSLLRVNYDTEVPNAAIHSDNTYEAYAGVLYLNPPEQCRGGTAFWRHKKYGFTHFPEEHEIRRLGKKPIRVYTDLHESYNDPDQWEQTRVVDMKFNRLLCFETKAFHSRWPISAFGTSTADARMIVAMFFGLI